MKILRGILGILTLISCFYSLSWSQPTLDWAKRWGIVFSESVTAIVSDAAGYVYVGGDFWGTVDFDPGAGTTNLTAFGLNDIFLAKFSASGNLMWVKQIGGQGSDNLSSMVMDPLGNLILGGFFMGDTDFDPGPSVYNLLTAGNDDAFVCKLSSSGSFAWAKRYGSNAMDQANVVATDPSGNVFLAGYFTDIVNFGGTTFISNNGSYDLFVLKLDYGGNQQWVRQAGGSDLEHIEGMTTDGLGNVILCGYFRFTVDFDPGTGTSNLTSIGAEDGFVWKLDASGNLVWAHQWGTPVSEYTSRVLTDPANNIFIAGYFMGTTDVAPGPSVFNVTSTGNSDVFLTKVDPQCGLLWAKSFGGIGGDSPTALHQDGFGNIYLSGIFTFAADFDPGPGNFNITAAGNWDAFYMKLDSVGAFRWAGSISGPDQDKPNAIAMGPSHSLYVGGQFHSTADFDPTVGSFNMTSAGTYDAFLIKVSQCNNQSTSDTISPTVCDNYTAPDGQVYAQSGTYFATIGNAAGCDSNITIQLTVQPIVATLTNASPTLTASPSGAQYQWLDCNNGFAAIPGATAQSFTANATGSYAVAVTVGSCSDTSACEMLDIMGLGEVERDGFEVNPNPSAGIFHVVLPRSGDLRLYNAAGAMVLQQCVNTGATELDLSLLHEGCYCLRLQTETGVFSKRLVVIR